MEHSGLHFKFPLITLRPAPIEPIPILVGGESRSALHRAARIGDGWTGAKADPSKVSECVAQLANNLDEVGRSIDGFEVRVRLERIT